jgi:SAM-dependent methyltransferase
MIKRLLTHPLVRGVDMDDPHATLLRRRILSQKQFLREIYKEWYQFIVKNLPSIPGWVLELGSGAGFLRRYLPHVITSDVLQLTDLSVVLDACEMPIQGDSLSTIVMIDVLHHLPQPRRFFHEATRCVRRNGTIIMIEPWVTPWSSFVYRRLHHEPFDPESHDWEFPTTGPLSGANGAIPWMLFNRDYERFKMEFPQWRLDTLKLDMPFSYLISGGVSLRSLAPGGAYKVTRWMEKRFDQYMDKLAMFAYIILKRLT